MSPFDFLLVVPAGLVLLGVQTSFHAVNSTMQHSKARACTAESQRPPRLPAQVPAAAAAALPAAEARFVRCIQAPFFPWSKTVVLARKRFCLNLCSMQASTSSKAVLVTCALSEMRDLAAARTALRMARWTAASSFPSQASRSP